MKWTVAMCVLAAAILLVIGAGWLARDGDSIALEAEPTDAPDAGEDAGTSFLAFADDFTNFREWERHEIAGAMLPIGAHEGPAYVYASAPPPAGAARWPVGTIMVKTVEHGPPQQWIIHAMVKRGVPYNREGAIGWEYFELSILEDGESMQMLWRGPGPPSGHGYSAAGSDLAPSDIPLVCNDCHGSAWQSDGVLTPALAFRP